ncbi:MAG: hypothetical protein VYA69_10595 [Gemmatimonadota bacterium]|nr:hypothetical protein [Gemmatimonadota bacterium]
MWLLINGQWFPPLVMTATGEILFLIMVVIFIGLSYSTASIIAESQIFQMLATLGIRLLVGTLVNGELLCTLPAWSISKSESFGRRQ